MRVLIAPLNWGLGHATRCIPLVNRYLEAGDEVVLGGDGAGLVRLHQAFPSLRTVPLAPLNLRYSAGKRQVWAMIKALPQLIRWAIADHYMLQALQQREAFDLVVSDNRFGLWLDRSMPHPAKQVYITHQLTVFLPHPYRWLEPLVRHWHAKIANHYDEVWVPDYADAPGLSGEMGHPVNHSYRHVRYIGPLSRMAIYRNETPDARYDTVCVISGLEPHRTVLEKTVITRYESKGEKLLVVEGKVNQPLTSISQGNITVVSRMEDRQLAAALLGATRIISRSGYSSVMDMEALSVRHKVEWHPTPGQPEQERLERLLRH